MKFLITLLIAMISTLVLSQKDSLITQFEIHNSEPSPQMDVLDIDRIEPISFYGKEIRLVIGGTGYATDFGAYREAYLIFDNVTEYPWRHAVYELGKFDNIKNLKKESDSSISFEAVLYSGLSEFECGYCVLKIIVDISDVLDKEKKLIAEGDDSVEGPIGSVLNVQVSKVLE